MVSMGIIYTVLAVIGVALVVGVLLSRYKVSSPSEAFVVSGARSKAEGITSSSRVVLGGGGVFVVPYFQRLFRISLEQRQIAFSVVNAVSDGNILVSLEGVASIKVGGDDGSVRAAAQRFLRQQGNIDNYTKEVLEGSLRAIVGEMTVDNINRNRADFASRVALAAGGDLGLQGLMVDTLQIKNVTTESGYIEDLGRPETAKVKQEAEVAEAKARQAAEEAQAKADIAIAEAQRSLALKQAEVRAETEAAQANAAAAGPIAEATRRQEILAQEKIAAQRQAEVVDAQLEAEVRRVADAAAYETRIAAEAAREAAVARATAEADAVRLRGIAEGEAIKAKGEAEAAAIQSRSDAYRDYPQAGILDIALGGMPAIVAEAAKPIGDIGTLTVVSTDGMNAVTRGATDVLTQTAATIKDVSGVDIIGLLQGAAGGFLASQAASQSTSQPTSTEARQEPVVAAAPAKPKKRVAAPAEEPETDGE